VALKLFGYARFAQSVLPEDVRTQAGRIVNVIGRSGHQPRRSVSPADEIAKVMPFLCSERDSYVTGEIVKIDGGGTPCV
jgi:enoyl-[acyl-carrier-protein] reductase (NADH)